MPSYGTIDPAYATRLATCDPELDGPVYMLNLMKYRDAADYGADGETGLSGREADDRYAPIDVLTAIGATVCFIADVVDASEDWDRVAVVRYPTRRVFIEMQSRRDFREKHVHKEAGMDHTVVMGTVPGGGLPNRANRPVLLEVWKGDAPEVVAHGTSTTFAVEGTIIGDGRHWDGARYTVLDADDTVDRAGGTSVHQLVLLQPVVERWN